MAAKQTKDEKIKSLEKQRDDLMETVELQNQRINQFQQEAEKEFLNSASYQQMQAELKTLRSQRDVDEMIIKQQRERLEQYKAEMIVLREQIDQGAGQAVPVHNARGAGRKPDLAKRQRFAQLYAAGTDMATIMEQMQIGRRTYYRYQAALRKNDSI